MATKENPGACAGASGVERPCYANAAGLSNVAERHEKSHKPQPGMAKAEAMTPDLQKSKSFLDALDPTASAWTFQTFDDDGRRKDGSLARVFHGTFDQHAASLAALQAQGAGIFVTVNETNLQGRKAANIKRVRALFVDLDGSPLEPVTEWEEPHIICETSPERWHAYWLVQDCPLASFSEVQKDLAETFGGDRSVNDLPRVMRLPGFYHLKGAPFMVRMIDTRAFPAPFTVAELRSKLDTIKPTPKLSEQARAASVQIDIGRAYGAAAAESGAKEVAEILTYIPPDCGYADWLSVLMGLHEWSGGSQQGLSIADDWSAKGVKYKPGEVAKKWKGFDASGGTKWATVPALARANGANLSAIASKYRGRSSKASSGQLCEPNQQEAETRSFEELLAAAKGLEPGQIEDIEKIVAECTSLNPMRADAVFRAIKDATRVSLGTIRAQLSQDRNPKLEPDHLDLARMTLSEIGRENVICADGKQIWRWQLRGVWTQQDDRAIKQAVQQRLSREASIDVQAALVNGVTDVLKTEIFEQDHEFNRGNPETVNCLNGELELDAGGWQLRPHCREHYRTTQIPVAYDPAADAPQFQAFLWQVFRDDPDREEKTRAVLELMGYTLMSHARHELFIMLIGPGANGKSVLLAVLEALLGSENVAGVQPANFDNRFQRAHLHQKLANIVTELKQGEVIADAELKAITSGEPATVEHKHKDPFVMRPFSTCWFGTNHMPHTRDFSEALFRRATILQFNRTFAKSEQDPQLKDKLKAELPGILNLALNAYANALLQGFIEPASSDSAKKEWRLEADQVALFVDEACRRDPEARALSGDVFKAYTSWASDNGINKTMSQKGLRDRLTRLGFGSYRDKTGRYVTGLRSPYWNGG
jgi:putative DNA primase/helicase